MIQRLQTLFLFLAGVINLSVYYTPIYSRAVHDPAGWIGKLFSILLFIATLLSLAAIFLYKDRVRQQKVVFIALLFQVASLGSALAVFFTLGGFGTFLLKEALSVLLIVISLIFIWQASRLIRKDQELVESMDRIR